MSVHHYPESKIELKIEDFVHIKIMTTYILKCHNFSLAGRLTALTNCAINLCKMNRNMK